MGKRERGFYNKEIVQPDILEYLMLIRWIGRIFLGVVTIKNIM